MENRRHFRRGVALCSQSPRVHGHTALAAICIDACPGVSLACSILRGVCKWLPNIRTYDQHKGATALINILVLEDQSDARKWLMALVRDAFPASTVEGFATLEQARKAAARTTFNVALIDINLPDGSGIELVREMTSRSPGTFCVMATIYDDDAHLFPALQAGARGYLLKGQPREKLLAQLCGIVKGEPPLSPSIAARIMQHFQVDQLQPHEQRLTERECEVLTLTATGLTRNEVGQSLGISSNTVAGHLKNIYRKLNITTQAEATLAAVSRGLVRQRK